MIEKIKKLLKDREKMNHYISYFIVGVITTLISWITFKLFRVWFPQVNENISNILSILIAIVCSYFMNRVYVFKSKEKNKLKEFGSFLSGRLMCMVLEELFFFLMIEFTEVDEMIVKMFGSAIAMVVNYLLSRFFVFKDTMKNKE